MEAGADVAAEKVLGLDIELVIAGLVQHAAAFDRAAVSSYTTLDGDDMPGRALNRGPVSEVGGDVLEARRTSSAWDSIVDLLAFLDAQHPGIFHRLMRGWVRLSDDPRVEDGCDDLLDDDEQAMFDLAADREVRRERQGYVTPAQAHAFLKGGRDLRLGGDRPASSAIARAYFRTIESTLTTEADARHEAFQALIESSPATPSTLEPSGVVEVLRDAGVLGRSREPCSARRISRPHVSRGSRRMSRPIRPAPKSSRTWRMRSWRDAPFRDGPSRLRKQGTAPWRSATSAWKTGRRTGPTPI